MYRHELRFVLRFGVRGQFEAFARRLYEQESACGWTAPRIWRATSGHVNQLIIERDYESLDTFRAERAAFHEEPGEVGNILAGLAELAVPDTAVEFELDGFDLVTGDRPGRGSLPLPPAPEPADQHRRLRS